MNSFFIEIEYTMHTKPPETRLFFSGEMTRDHLQAAALRLQSDLEGINSQSSVILDLTRVNRIDSRGIALCISLYKECTLKNADFIIEAGSNVMSVFRLIKLDRVLPIREVCCAG